MICKKCHGEIDDTATMCAHCGAKTKKIRKKKLYQRWWFWVLLIFIAFYAIGSSAEDDISDETTLSTSAQAEPAGEEIKEPTEPAATTPKITVYKSGMYKVGSEIEPGEYFITHTKGISAYMQVNSDSTGSFDSIVANENIATFHYISVIAGQYLTVKQGTFVKAEDAEIPKPDSDGNYCEGMYRVGIDIPAGEYKITPRPGDNIYYEVTSDSTGGFASIVTNEFSSDPTYITLNEGQYFKLKDGTFTLVE